MSETKSGHHCVCAVPNCFNKGYTTKKKFYHFPKEPKRARIWAMNANREDLLEKLPNLHKSYTVCESHFEETMFTSHLHARLVGIAIPTLFPSLERTSRTPMNDHSYSAPPLLPAKIPVLVPAVAEFDSADPTIITTDTELTTEVEIQSSPLNTSSPPLMYATSSTQTSASLASDTQTIKYRQSIESLTAENKYLRERVQVLETQLNNTECLPTYFSVYNKYLKKRRTRVRNP